MKHFHLSGISAGTRAGALYVVHVEGNIHDAMAELQRVAGVATCHGRGCQCDSPETNHKGTVIRDGEVVR